MRSLLENELLSVRLYAARQAESSAELRSSRLPRVVLWWALARTGFTGEPGPRWLVRRRMVQRRRKLTREECLASFRRVEHPLACLAHAMRLVELHGQDAIPALLEVLPQVARSEAHAEAVAWALGTLGRTILAETLAAARKASPAVRHWLLLALWFLGPEAHGVEKDLLGWAEPMAEAVLLNLESRAAAQAARDGRVEVVYLDDAAVYELAEQIYGLDNLARRRRAVRALRGFGPAQEAAVKLLAACLDDPDLSTTAARTLVEYHPEEALRPLLRDESFFPFIAQLPDVRERLRRMLQDADEALLEPAARAAIELAVSLTNPTEVLRKTSGKVRLMLLRLVPRGELSLQDLRLMAADSEASVRLYAAVAMRGRRDGQDILLRLANDSELNVAANATLALLEQNPEDDALATGLLKDKFIRRRVVKGIQTCTPAMDRALARLPDSERVEIQSEEQFNTYTNSEMIDMLEREQNVARLAKVADADGLVCLVLERIASLPSSLVAEIIRRVGPRVTNLEVLRPLVFSADASISGAVLAVLRRIPLERHELQALLDHSHQDLRLAFWAYLNTPHANWFLDQVAKDQDPRLREAVAREAYPDLAERMLLDPDEEVGKAAVLRLSALRHLPDSLRERVRRGEVADRKLLELVSDLLPGPELDEVLEAGFLAGQRTAIAPLLGKRLPRGLQPILETFDQEDAVQCLELALDAALGASIEIEGHAEPFLASARRAEVLQALGRLVSRMSSWAARHHRHLLLLLASDPATREAGLRGLGKLLEGNSDSVALELVLEHLPSHPEAGLQALARADLEPEQWERFRQMVSELPPGLQPGANRLLYEGRELTDPWAAFAAMLDAEVDLTEAAWLIDRLVSGMGLHSVTPTVVARLGLDDPDRRWFFARLLLERGLNPDELVPLYVQRDGPLPPRRTWVEGLRRSLRSPDPAVLLRALDHLDTLRAWEAREALDPLLSHEDERVRTLAQRLRGAWS